jgi:hypothetical protein
MTVEQIVTDRDEVVSLLQIHVPHNAYISVDSEYSHCVVNLADSPKDAARDGEVVLTASRITRQGDDFAYIQTFIGANANSGSTFAGGPGSRAVPAATTLDSYFTISASSGDYKLDSPVVIARLDGKPVTLTVGQPKP